MHNVVEVNISTVAEMKAICDYLGMDSVEYLGDVDLSNAKEITIDKDSYKG